MESVLRSLLAGIETGDSRQLLLGNGAADRDHTLEGSPSPGGYIGGHCHVEL
jgi:hypothetical protein